MNLEDPIREAIGLVPKRIALIVDDDEITFADLGVAIERVSSALVAAGVAPGDRVPLVASSGLLAVATVLACARIGAAAAPMSARATASEIDVMARAAGCGEVAVAERDVADRISGRKTLSEEILSVGGKIPTPAQVNDDDISVVLFTSGTTGTPKPVPFSHAVLGGRVKAFAAVDPSAPTLVSISCVPFHHVAGLVGVFVGLAGENTVVLQRRFDAGAWLRVVEDRRVNRIFLVPTMLHRILDHPDVSKTDLSSVQLITYGAAPASPELIARARAVFPPSTVFLQVFGQTETLGGVVALGPGDEEAGEKGSVGKPMPGVEVRVVDPGTGEDVPDGEVGEFWARAPHTATPGWIRSGDLVRRDADGYIYAVGRMSDVINRGGEKIDPAEVEGALRAHPNVRDVAVAGYPDPDLGENVGAVVVASSPLSADDLRTHVRARLASFKVPARIVFVDEIPLTELGKISRRDLKKLLSLDFA